MANTETGETACDGSAADTRLIAVVDDDLSVRKALQRAARAAGYEAVVYDTGPAFLDGFDEKRPACVVLDIHMGRMTGFDVLDILRERHIRIPAIIITAHDSLQSRDRARAAGALYLRKPFGSDSLLDLVHRALTGFA